MATSKELGLIPGTVNGSVEIATTIPAAIHVNSTNTCHADNDPSAAGDNNMSTAPSPIHSETPTQRSNLRTGLILLALYLTVFIAALDQTIIATAVPSITKSLHSARGYTWIGGSYLIANAASGPIWTKLSDIWGRKPILLVAVGWFFAASVACARARDMRMLIIWRAMQGTAGGGCLGQSIVTICDLFSLRRRTLWLGCLEVMWAIAGGAGPLLGGLFAQTIGWQWIFWFNLPIIGLAFILLLFFLDVHNPRTNMWQGLKAIDWFGSLSILGVTLMLLLGLDFGGETFPWNSPKIICLLVFGSVTTLVFIFSEKKLAKYPLMPLVLFENRSNVAALVVTLAHGIVFIGGEYYIPLYLQATHGASPIRSGLLVLPLNISEAISGMLCGLIMHEFHAIKEVIIVGTALMALGTGLYINFGPTTSIAEIVGFELISGLGCGSLFHAPVIAIQAFTAQKHIASATATQAFVRGMATSIGVVIGGVIFQNSMAARAGDLRRANLPATLLEQLSGGEAAANVGIVATLEGQTQVTVIKEAFAGSIRNMWICYTCVAVLGVTASFFVKNSRLSEEHTETRTGLEKDVVSAAEVELRTVGAL